MAESWQAYSRAMSALDAVVESPNPATRENLSKVLVDPLLCSLSLVQMRDILVYRNWHIKYKKDKRLITRALHKIGFEEKWEARLLKLDRKSQKSLRYGTR